MSCRISTKAAESGQTTGGPADDAIAPPVSSATAAEEHHTVVEPEIIEPEILPKQASGKTAAHKAAKPMDVTDALSLIHISMCIRARSSTMRTCLP